MKVIWERISNSDGIMTLEGLREFLKTRKRPFRFLFCHSKDEEYEVDNTKGKESECYK